MAAWEDGFISDCGSDMVHLEIVLYLFLHCQFIFSQGQGFSLHHCIHADSGVQVPSYTMGMGGRVTFSRSKAVWEWC